jgi:hypothetical protein
MPAHARLVALQRSGADRSIGRSWRRDLGLWMDGTAAARRPVLQLEEEAEEEEDGPWLCSSASLVAVMHQSKNGRTLRFFNNRRRRFGFGGRCRRFASLIRSVRAASLMERDRNAVAPRPTTCVLLYLAEAAIHQYLWARDLYPKRRCRSRPLPSVQTGQGFRLADSFGLYRNVFDSSSWWSRSPSLSAHLQKVLQDIDTMYASRNREPLAIVVAILSPNRKPIERLVLRQSEPVVVCSEFIDASLLTLSRIASLPPSADIPTGERVFKRYGGAHYGPIAI